MNQNIKLSIIIPVFNAEQYLGRCVDSIIGQDYENLEIIIVDDGSVDDSFAVCRYYESKDPRVVLVQRENGGQMPARMTGVDFATGDYIGFVDADDYIDRDMYSRVVEKIDDCMPDMVLFGLKEIYPDRVIVKNNRFKEDVYRRNEMEKVMFPSMLSYDVFFEFGILPNLVCKFVRRDFFRKSSLSVSENIVIGEDADATFQLIIQSNIIQTVDINPYNYCKRPDSMMWKPLSSEAIDSLESDLARSFKAYGVYNILKGQLEDYITFVRLFKRPASVSGINSLFSGSACRVALYGAGGFGQALYHEYPDRIALWADIRNHEYSDRGMPVIPVDELVRRQDECDFVFISILNTALCRKIRDELTEAGMKKDIIFWGNI